MGKAMRTDRYRFVRWYNRKTRKVQALELYDHRTDPAENVNIARRPENAALVQELNRLFDRGWDGLKPE